ncbi:D-aminoacyl-tRNA deacylase [uncultured Corynebacterium sp.]|uniref:D-aminoacyl-tRNA deacylase n=1 Tax=uncultured Corynebacterium sp. TaxID=159447 RepID=UPI0025F3084A|nr:D-aminoacyl-tRNA deacylase [uncultured Corynebacterium sp.]
MKAVVTRVRSASVVVHDSVVGSIPDSDVGGLLVLIGVATGDTPATAQAMAEKLARLRIFEGLTPEERPTEVSALDVGAPLLVVSQFTLMGDTSHGRRPSWSAAAKPAKAEPIFTTCVEELRSLGLTVETGVFGAYMGVESVNDGPFTVLVDIPSGTHS